MKKHLWDWLAASVILVVIFGTVYATAQHSLRQTANDPQIQMAEDIAAQLNTSSSIGLNNSQTVDIASSLAPFIIAYDKDGNVVSGTGRLNGEIPKIPKGVLDHAKPQHRITWQPRNDIRIAAVVQANGNGYVLAGRSIREVEKRENEVFIMAGLGGLISELILSGLFIYKGKTVSKKS